MCHADITICCDLLIIEFYAVLGMRIRLKAFVNLLWSGEPTVNVKFMNHALARLLKEAHLTN